MDNAPRILLRNSPHPTMNKDEDKTIPYMLQGIISYINVRALLKRK
jgi:hypothetical protein